MSGTTVDNRVVEMQFDNKQFESNVKTSMSTLEKLKQSLNLKGASKGLEDVSEAAKNNKMHVLGNAVETVQAKFSALQVMGVTALANITNSAVNAGKRMVKALTLDPIMTGFQEYETQINAVQTILANTQSKGTTLANVNAALDELNKYADMTIYNFTEMTRNIGTFTAAGVDLDTSVSAIKGIANLAAVSGSNSQQASTAMYQLSQALAAGTVKLMDWNSVVNAGMGGQVFQDALKETARVHGIKIDEMIEKEGSFRETLQNGWLSSEILTETLAKFTGDLTEEQLRSMGYTAEQAQEIMKLGETANDAATKVKTFTQLWDTLKEAAQSGWTQTWEILVGDFEEAKELLTSISDVVSGVLNESAEARNSVLQGWKDLGGRTALIDGFKSAFESLASIAGTVKDAFSEVFPAITSEQLFNLTDGFKKLMESLKPTTETLEKIKRVAKGIFSAFDLVRKGIGAILSPITKLFSGGGISGLANFLLEAAASIGDFFTALNEGAGTEKFFSNIKNAVSTMAQGISGILKGLFGDVQGFGAIFSSIGEAISNVAGKIGDALGNVFGWIKENIGIGDVFAGLAGGGILITVKKLSGVFKKVKDLLGDWKTGGLKGLIFGTGDDSEKTMDKVRGILDSLRESLTAFTTGIKVGTLLSIAVAVGVLTSSLNTLSKIDPAKLSVSLGAIAGLMVMLNLSYQSIIKSLSTYDAKGIVKSAFSLILIATAVNILANALKKISELSVGEIAKGLIGIGSGLAILCKALESINKSGKASLKSAISIVILAEACKVLGDALAKFGNMSWDEIAHGLVGMGGALAELVGVMAAFDKIGGKGSLAGSASLVIAVQSLDEISENLERLGNLSWEEIGKGLSAMGGALAEFTAALGVLSKVGGFGSLLGGGAITIAVQSLDEISAALKDIGAMSWEEIARGLSGMGGALTEVGAVTGLLGKLAGLSGIIGSGTLLLSVQSLGDLADAFKKFGGMNWEEIARGLSGMGGALTEVGVVTGLLGKLAGISGLIGSGALLLAIQGLGDLADAFKKFGDMSWEEIARGLVGMGGALTEVAVVSGLLGTLGGLGALIGSGSLLLGIQGLGDLADALKKFGEMSWDEIGRGLAAMGAAMGETALGGVLNTLSGIGGISIGAVAESLGTLADSFKKFGEMDWDQVQTGLAAMGAAMGETALGGLLNTFSGLGANSIATIAEPLGALADSVKKWSGVTVPEGLGTQLASLAPGISAFNFSGWGADAIASVAEPLGTLADSVSKWSSVTVPEGLGENLKSLAPGISAFNFSGWGADAIAALATPLGDLAGSVSAWSTVTIPEGMSGTLSSLASGVSSFNFVGWGADGMAATVEPLKNLADTITVWSGVVIPEGIGGKLTELAGGVKAFNFAGWGADAIASVAEPLKTLADSVTVWAGVTVPEGIKDNLTNLAAGVKAFNFSGWGADAIAALAEPLGKLAGSITSLNGANIPSDIKDKLTNLAAGIKAWKDVKVNDGISESLKTLADGIKAWNGVQLQAGLGSNLQSVAVAVTMFSNISVGNLSGICDGIRGIGQAVTDISGVDFGGVSAKLTEFANAINSIDISANSFSNLGSQMINGLIGALASGVGRVQSTMNSLVNLFKASGLKAVNSFAAGIKSGTGSARSAVSSMASRAASAAKSSNAVFRSAGYSAASGFASGIASGSFLASVKARAMANAAVKAAKDALSINSPSKVFMGIGQGVPEGFAKGIDKYGYYVDSSIGTMASNALDNTKSAISRVGYAISNIDMDAEPTIRPVIDLSDVKSGAAAISGMFSDDFALGMNTNLNAISASMRRRNQNGDNEEVVSAIDRLRKDVGNLENKTINLGGVTYSADDELNAAFETIVRYAIIERRT